MNGNFLVCASIRRRVMKEHPEGGTVYDRPCGMISSVTLVGDPDDLDTWEWVPTGTDELKTHLFLIVTGELRAIDMRDARGSVMELSPSDDPRVPMRLRLVCKQVISKPKLHIEKPAKTVLINKMFDRNVALFPAEFMRIGRPAFLRILRDRQTEPLTVAERNAEF